MVSGATTVVKAHPNVGVLVVPRAGNDPDALPLDRVWAMDNGAFSGLDVPMFLRMLRRFSGREGCKFVTAPDVVGNATETAEMFKDWEPLIHLKGFPVAFVGQDGLNLADVPWDSCEAIFVGGTTIWKLGRTARDLVAYAKARGKWAHMGRVNSHKRIVYAKTIGCDSIDGTKWSRWSQRWIPTYAKSLERYQGGPLFQ
jgi:hypothetical protein